MVDAKWVKHLGRDPVSRVDYRGWTIEVDRVGRYHEYQAPAIGRDGEVLQTARCGGPGARDRAAGDAERIVNRWTDRRA